ncbi:hypothetical protein [Nannocystis pusilla]|uniref:hypothetical protein n=1 Tax=Nannocystis pusilla TaxID=889268 RepID=UPI003DA45DF1
MLGPNALSSSFETTSARCTVLFRSVGLAAGRGASPSGVGGSNPGKGLENSGFSLGKRCTSTSTVTLGSSSSTGRSVVFASSRASDSRFGAASPCSNRADINRQ